MPTISELKELSATETPLFLVSCELANGAIERWSTHAVQAGGEVYEARILRHNLFEIGSDADGTLDTVAKVSLTLSNTDSYGSQIERTCGWKGAKITIRFVFFDLKLGMPATEETVIFRGLANPPDEVTESALRLTVTSRLNLQRQLLPEVRIQRRCPWKFPTTVLQRETAVTGGSEGKYSAFYRCGYSPDITGGAGNMIAGVPYASCNYTRAECEQRGMFDRDAQGNPTRRFGGIEFVPSTTLVRSYGEKGFHAAPVQENEARYNDFVPLVYGTAWCAPPVVFARNDGNLTHMEVLLGMGEIQGVLKVLVNDIEIPAGQAGTNMTATGWYNVVSLGGRTGNFNSAFLDAGGVPAGDPYGSMAVMSVAVPNRVNDGRTLARVQVLLQGLKLSRYDASGTYLDDAFDNNPAWVILDILRRTGWRADEIDFSSFASAAAHCAEPIMAEDAYGNSLQMPRFQCNLAVRKRRSAAELIRGIRSASGLYLVQGADGRLQLRVETTLAAQQPVKPTGSNSTQPLNGGWPAYEFGDGTLGSGGILRRENGEPAIRLWSRSTADTPNRFSVEFQDALNEYQQDSLSLVDVDDVLRTGQEVSVPLNALGIPNFHQAARVIQLQLSKALRGGTFVEFETSVRGVGLRPGDIITLTYLKEGFLRQCLRVKSIAPGLNYATAVLTAQIHDDAWYTDDIGGAGTARTGRQPGFEIGLPRPIIGKALDEEGEPQLEITERAAPGTGEEISVWLSAGFVVPPQPSSLAGGIPLLDLAPTISQTGGALKGDQTLYYAVSAVRTNGEESALSFIVRAAIPPGGDTNTVQLTRLSFAPGTQGFHVYRGRTPAQLFRITSNQPVSSEFTDTGLPIQLATPPDPNYDHARFYWRFELQPECAVTVFGADTAGNDLLAMPVNGYSGMVARITKGKGAGQERAILSNTATTVTVSIPWETVPDATSRFAIAEASWRLGAIGRTSPVEFEIPNRVGATVHVSGRSANVHGWECAYELSPLTRWRIGSTAAGIDTDVPPKPIFGLSAQGLGAVELLGVGFDTLVNTRTVTAGTLTLHYWPELSDEVQPVLALDIDGTATTINLNTAGTASAGQLIQIGKEIVVVTDVLAGGLQYSVLRAAHGTTGAAHAAGTRVYHLNKSVSVVPFIRDFFGSPASGNFRHSLLLPDVRIASAQLVVMNSRGNSEAGELALTATEDDGLRTLSGGQLSIQVEGYLAIQSDVAPPLVVEEAHGVRDVFAVVREAPAGGPIVVQLRRASGVYCTLTIPPGGRTSNVVGGFGMPLEAKEQLALDILSVGPAASGSPGKDLTVTIRL